MATIIAGVFGNISEANKVVEELREQQFARNDISVFHLNAAGQHDKFPGGGDQDEDPGAEQSDKAGAAGAAVGATALGIAAAAAGPAAVAAAAAVGAYTGSFAGALGGMGQSERARRAGAMVAVNVSESGSEDAAIDCLKQHRAMDIEKAEGEWFDGEWIDFDPVRPPDLVEQHDASPRA